MKDTKKKKTIPMKQKSRMPAKLNIRKVKNYWKLKTRLAKIL